MRKINKKLMKTFKGMFSSVVANCNQRELIVICDNFEALQVSGCRSSLTFFEIGQTVRFIGIQKNENFPDGSVKMVRFEYAELEYLGPINCFTTEDHWIRLASAIISEDKRMSAMKRDKL